MWYLTSENDDKVLYLVPHKKEVTLGRSPDIQICNYAILDDSSLSRRHASLSLSDDNCLYVQDLDSKYGTFINESPEKLEPKQKVQLNKNDVVKFGKLACVWRVQKVDFVSCTSTLKGENLQNLKATIEKMGGRLKNEWDESCGFLTMPALTLTIKVVLALVQGSYIVTTEFWSKCLESVNNNLKLPEPSLYTPEVIESSLNKDVISFLPNRKRKSLFSGKKFVFFSKRQYDMYRVALLNSSAEPILLSEAKLSKQSLCDENTIVIQYNPIGATQSDQKTQINEITDYLKNNGKRLIPDPEIGLAILYCSIDKYCNTEFNFLTEVTKTSTIQNNPAKVLAQETQETVNTTTREPIKINESLSGDAGNKLNNSSKRKLDQITDFSETNINKKVASGHNDIKQNINKRKFTNDNTTEQNPTKKVANSKNSSESQDLFNFNVDNGSHNSTDHMSEKKLNLSKPVKRKADDLNDDDLFNFIQPNDNSESNHDTAKVIRLESDSSESTTLSNSSKQTNKVTPEDILAMRGTKLQELMKNSGNSTVINPYIKKEATDDLDQKMNDLVLGTTIVTIKKELIVKKEPVEIEVPMTKVQNFKKFKKVWPVKMQVTIIPKSSSLNNVTGNNTMNSMVFNDGSS